MREVGGSRERGATQPALVQAFFAVFLDETPDFILSSNRTFLTPEVHFTNHTLLTNSFLGSFPWLGVGQAPSPGQGRVPGNKVA